jgi:hypothetical protein
MQGNRVGDAILSNSLAPRTPRMTKQITLPEQLLQTLLGGEKQARAAIAQARKQVEAEIAQLGK